ncbi:lysophospholipid acyltransferase family protein [Rhodobacter xanthinilyticus]|nr:lysophospholipid acyltransferase family protein [Rhodobacter xanthinilyticus]
MSDTDPTSPAPLTDRLVARGFALAMGALGRLPYPRRIATAGAIARGLAPLIGWRRRIRENLALACPDLPPEEVARLTRAVPDNIGRSLAEIYAGPEFLARVRDLPLTGPGAALLESLKAEGKPAVLVTGHYGNYDAWRGALGQRGYPVGALYRPMNNRAFNDAYVAAIQGIAGPMWPRDKRGMGQMLRHLREGGMVGLAIDQFFHIGARLTFFGQIANTPLSAAELALKYDAPLIPIFARRLPDGLRFEITVEAPIPSGTPEEMSQAFNDRLEAQVRAHMEQWLWVHRRWKVWNHEEELARARGEID